MNQRQWLLRWVMAAMVFVVWSNLRLAYHHHDHNVDIAVSSSSSLPTIGGPKEKKLQLPPPPSFLPNEKKQAPKLIEAESHEVGGSKKNPNLLLGQEEQTPKTTATTTKNTNLPFRKNGATKILGFADKAYIEYALRWYHRLEFLGYQQQVIVAVDRASVEYYEKLENKNIRWEALPYPPCVDPTMKKNQRLYRRQLFGRRWKYVYEQLQAGYSVLLTDVDNVFSRHLSLEELEDSEYDVFHAYSTSYPTHVFEDMGFTVCGGMSWLRADPKVIRFVGTLVNTCHCLTKTTTEDVETHLCQNCHCDDQVVLNEMLWKGKHQVTWDFPNTTTTRQKPKDWSDYPWKSLTGTSKKTRHRIYIWDRHVAYRAPLPETCPPNNWVSMPLYVDRHHVHQVWDALCHNSITNNDNTTKHYP